jgi:large subunit ribosomal protein L25
MTSYKFDVTKRADFGKGFARRLRASGNVPAVIYGAGKEAIHIALPTHDVLQAIRQPNALFEISVDGSTHLALVKDIQREFSSRKIEHLDLLEVTKGQKVNVPVALKVVGETKPATQVSISVKALVISTEATSIPQSIELNIEGADAGDHFTVGDVQLPEGSVAALSQSHVIVAVKARAAKKAVQIDVAGGGPEENDESKSEG